MNVTKVKCELCGREISKNNYSKSCPYITDYPSVVLLLHYVVKSGALAS